MSWKNVQRGMDVAISINSQRISDLIQRVDDLEARLGGRNGPQIVADWADQAAEDIMQQANLLSGHGLLADIIRKHAPKLCQLPTSATVGRSAGDT